MNENMDLMTAMQIIASAGLTITSSDGNVEAKPKKRVKGRRSKGSGSVYKLSGSRKKPYVASVTIGYDDEDGHQTRKSIGYFTTREEAQNALEVYNMQKKGLIKGNLVPTVEELEKNKVKCPTFKEIWDIIFEEDIEKKSYSTMINYKVSFNNLSEIHCMRVNEINLHILQPVFDKVMKDGSGHSKLNMMKVVCKAIFDYAMKYDYIEKDYTQFIQYKATNKNVRERTIFTTDEINNLIKNGSIEAKIVLIYIFTGLRPQELLGIRKENIHLDEDYMIGGMKTSNGKNRIIPIHHIIKKYIKELMENNNQFLIFDYCGRKAYEQYRSNIFNKLFDKHDPYDTRHTFATIAKLSNINEFARKKIMGHSCKDLTDDVYTHAPIQFLVKEVNKIKFENL
ncbi:MAG: tyrosine-type recombinase/integrase [Bacilli bacterium]|nr:tyrosine-type recombinase/integrase [Bacilli bacterium]